MFSWLTIDKKKRIPTPPKSDLELARKISGTKYHSFFFNPDLFEELKKETQIRENQRHFEQDVYHELDMLIESLGDNPTPAQIYYTDYIDEEINRLLGEINEPIQRIPTPPPNPRPSIVPGIVDIIHDEWDSITDEEEEDTYSSDDEYVLIHPRLRKSISSYESSCEEEYISGREKLTTPINDDTNPILPQHRRNGLSKSDSSIPFPVIDWDAKFRDDFQVDDDNVNFADQWENNHLFDIESGRVENELTDVVVEKPVTFKDVEKISADIGRSWGEESYPEGYLELNIGPMFSGKSSKMLFKLSSLADQRMKCLYINSSKDVRKTESQDENVTTHNSCYSKLSDKITQIKTHSLSEVDVSDYDYVGVDEFQFFGNGANIIKQWLDMGKYIIIASLDADCYRRRFGTVLDLVPYANEITKLNAYCDICRDNYKILKKAPFTLRITSDTSAELVGGVDLYRAACRSCHDFHLNHTISF